MNEEPGFVAATLRDLAASTAAILAAWGALGGATPGSRPSRLATLPLCPDRLRRSEH